MWAIDYLSAHPIHLLPNFLPGTGNIPKEKKGMLPAKKRLSGDVAWEVWEQIPATPPHLTLPYFARTSSFGLFIVVADAEKQRLNRNSPAL